MKKLSVFIILLTFILFPLGSAKAAITSKLSYGMTGSQVSELQQDLKNLGYYSKTINGSFDYNTYLSLQSFQNSKGVNPTGSLDYTTLNLLNKVLLGIPSKASYGMKNDLVAELQTYLKALGYMNVNPTGYFGSITLDALKRFQRDNGLVVDGIAGKITFNKIFEVVDKKYAPYFNYVSYTVIKGDTIWSVATKFNITMDDLKKANNLTQEYLSIGQVLSVPVRVVPVKPYYYKYGEYLDWFSSANYVFPIGKEATVVDFFSGKSFKIKRTIGAGHADCETLTANDTAIYKEIFGGTFSWDRRPIIVIVDGRRIVASMAGMPHAGLDAYPADANVNNRSDGYGYGPNYDYIKGNNMDGHFDIHFIGSIRHKDGLIDQEHQNMIKISSNR